MLCDDAIDRHVRRFKIQLIVPNFADPSITSSPLPTTTTEPSILMSPSYLASHGPASSPPDRDHHHQSIQRMSRHQNREHTRRGGNPLRRHHTATAQPCSEAQFPHLGLVYPTSCVCQCSMRTGSFRAYGSMSHFRQTPQLGPRNLKTTFCAPVFRKKET